jgi:hypothetical protein
MNKNDAESHMRAILRVLSDARSETLKANSYGRIVLVERDGNFRVFYRNVGDGLRWELTDASPELAAMAIERWNSAAYRALRPSFEALLAAAENEWIEPQLDMVRVAEPPFGSFRIEATAETIAYRLVWQNDTGSTLDLTGKEPVDAVRAVFGDTGVDRYRDNLGLDCAN